MKLEEIPAYKRASGLSDYVWDIVIMWGSFERYGLGRQFTDAIDSISANVAEGFGRYYKRDKIRTFYNARAEVFEAAHWCKKAFVRKLLTHEQQEYILKELRLLPREINYLIKMTDHNLSI